MSIKPFDDLTAPELRALTPQEIALYIDYQCAHEGIRLLPPPPGNAPTKPTVETVTMFVVGGFILADHHEAERLQTFVGSLKSLHKEEYIGGSYRRRFLTPTSAGDDAAISTKTAMTEAVARANDAALQAFEDVEEEHEKAVREYDQITSQRKKIKEHVESAIEAAWSTYHRTVRLEELFERYLELAGGDRVIAARFLEKAEGEARALLPVLFEEPALATPEPSPALIAAAEGASDEIPW